MKKILPITSWVKANITPLLLFVGVAACEIGYQSANNNSLQPLLGGLRIAAIVTFAFFLVFRNATSRYHGLKSILVVTPIIATIATIWLFAADPILADRIAREDSLIENLSAIFLIGSSALLALLSFSQLLDRRPAQAAFALIIGIVLFTIGMEEISWMQRILDVESTEFFVENNRQGEINLHNLHTDLFEYIYYTGAFVCLVLVPFFSRQLVSVFKKTRLHALLPLLPSLWVLLPSSVMIGFITPSMSSSVYTILMTTVTIFILIYLATTNGVDRRLSLFAISVMLLLVIAFSSIFFISFDYSDSDIRHWVASEYREMFIGLGFLVYALDRVVSLTGPLNPPNYPSKR